MTTETILPVTTEPIREHFQTWVVDITKNTMDLKSLCTMARSARKLNVERYKLEGRFEPLAKGQADPLCKECKQILRDLCHSLNVFAQAILDPEVVVRQRADFAKRAYGWNLASHLKTLAQVSDRLRRIAEEIEGKTKRYFPEGCDFDSLYIPLEASNGRVLDDRAARLGLEIIHELKWAFANIDTEVVMREALELDKRGREALMGGPEL